LSTAPQTTSGVSADHDGELSHGQIRTILFGLMAGMFLAALDQTIVSTAIRTIGDDLHGLQVQAWVTTAYLITSTIATPLYGKLSDIYGRRPFFLIAISLFVAGSIMCTFATSMYMLAAFRAFQGLGAGGLFSLALAILADIVPPRQRAKYQGYFLAVFGTSSVLGPLVGGALAGTNSILWIAGWRWVFLVNVPIGIVALILVAKTLHIPHVRRDHRIDYWGAAMLVVGLVPLLIVAEQGQAWGWGSLRVILLIALGIVGLAAFVAVEFRMKDEALIPMRLFHGNFSLGMLANAVVGMGLFGAILVLPLYLQIVRGDSPTKSGLSMLPLVIGLMLGSVISGQLTSRTGKYKIFPVIGTLVFSIVTFTLMASLKVDSGYWFPLFVQFLFLGFGLGLCMQTLLIAVQNVVPARDIGVATSSATFFRQMGGTIGVAVFISVLFDRIQTTIPTAINAARTDPAFLQAAATQANLNPADLQTAAGQQAVQNLLAGYGGQIQSDSSFLQRIPSILARPYQIGFTNATHLIFLLAGIVVLVGFLVVLMIKETPLRTMSASQEARLEQASMQAETLPAQSAEPGGQAHADEEQGDDSPFGLEADDTVQRAENHHPGQDAGHHSASATEAPAVSVDKLVAESDLVDGNGVAHSEHGRHEA
jgi:EmrB/QacA subfamily drug resistance transporter